MQERITLLEETQQNQKRCQLAHEAVVAQFQEQLKSKDMQISRLRQKAHVKLPDVKQVLTPIKMAMEGKQQEVSLAECGADC